MLRLYNTALLPLRAAAALYAAWASRDPARAVEWAERRARTLPSTPPGGLWIHAASVGEVAILRQIVRVLRVERERLPIATSCTTPAGRAGLSEASLADAAFFVPLDFAGMPGRILDALRPRALVLVETELWPNLLHEAAERGVEAVVVNARLAPERMARYRRLRALYAPLTMTLRVGAQSAADAARFAEIGVPDGRISVTGNVKYDLPVPATSGAELRARFGLGERPVVVAGSTGEGEEALVLDAFLATRKVVPSAYLVLAPRHVARAAEVLREAAARGVTLVRRSSVEEGGAPSGDGLLVDTLGELSGLYAMAGAAFVGGSLVPIGGHNVLEPAAAGVPVLFGPHTQHVAEPARALLSAGAALRVDDSRALGSAFTLLCGDRERARAMGAAGRAVVSRNGGALLRTVELVLEVAREARARSAP